MYMSEQLTLKLFHGGKEFDKHNVDMGFMSEVYGNDLSHIACELCIHFPVFMYTRKHIELSDSSDTDE